MNYLIRIKKIKPSHLATDAESRTPKKEIQKEDIGDAESVDGFTIQLFTIGIIVLENMMALYGNLTGVVSTGLALVKEIDPNLESSATRNLVLGSGAGLFVGFPMMLLLNVPVVGFVTHNPTMYLYTMLGLVAYFIILSVALYIRRPK